MSRPIARILLADPHAMVRRGVRMMVEELGYCQVVAEASNGREAFNLASQTMPTIAIVGLGLPELNGAELTYRLSRVCPQTAVLVYTVRDSEKAIFDALRAGARGYVLKSAPASTLVAAIDALLSQRSYFCEKVSEVLLENFRRSKMEAVDSCLSHREREVVQLIAEGLINKQIGRDLKISTKTVESHRAKAMRKLSLRTTADLVRFAVRNDMVRA